MMVTRARDVARRGVHQRRPARCGAAPRGQRGLAPARAIRRASARSVVARLLQRRAGAARARREEHDREQRRRRGGHRRERRSARAGPASAPRPRGQPVAQRLDGEDGRRQVRASSRAAGARGRPPCACPRRTSSPRRSPAAPGATARGPCASSSATSSANSLAVRCTALAARSARVWRVRVHARASPNVRARPSARPRAPGGGTARARAPPAPWG